MKYIFNETNKIFSQIECAKHILLAFDYDGTLTPIVGHPELARLDKNIRKAVRGITSYHFCTIAIISGRSLVDLKKRVGIDEIYYVGNHGLEIEGPSLKFTSPEGKRNRLLMLFIEEDLAQKLKRIKGAFVENKKFSLSVHFRQVSEKNISKVSDIFYSTLDPLIKEKRIKTSYGKKILGVYPPLKLNKGRVLLWMIKNLAVSHSEVLPIYMGDDQADESVFDIVNKRGGLSIFVGKNNRRSCAKYHLKSVKDLEIFLEQIKKVAIARKFKE